jgi:hypothetical protein
MHRSMQALPSRSSRLLKLNIATSRITICCVRTSAALADSERSGGRRTKRPTPAATHRAVFLDRDGVTNRPIIRDGKPYPPRSLEEFELLPRVDKACQMLKEAGFLWIVANN